MRKLRIFPVIFCFCSLSWAQDPPFALYTYAPLYVTPTASVCENYLNAFVHYRQTYQLPNVSNHSPQATLLKPFMSKTKENKIWGGIGLMFASNRYGEHPSISREFVSTGYAHVIHIANELSLALGASASGGQVTLNRVSGITTGSQYSQNYGYDPNLPTNEPIESEVRYFYTFGIGMHLQKKDAFKIPKYYVALGLHNINKANISFGNMPDYIPVRANLHAWYRLEVSGKWVFTPEILYLYQRIHGFNIGGKITYVIREVPDMLSMQNFKLNLYIRNWLFQYSGLGLELKWPTFFVAVYYDVNTSPSSNIVLNTGAVELAMGFRTKVGLRKQFKDIPEYMDYQKEPDRTKNKSRKQKRAFKQKEQFIKPPDAR